MYDRKTVFFTVLMALAGLPGLSAGATLSAEASPQELVYVGTQAHQIHALHLNTMTGRLTDLGVVAEGPQAAWLEVNPAHSILYAVDEDTSREGSVTAYAIDRYSGALTKVSEVGAGGRGTTNLHGDATWRTLLAANYATGSVSSIEINADGSLKGLVSTVRETGTGPNRRQASAHAHSAVVDPSGRYVVVPDLGADRVFIYGFNSATHALSEDATLVSHAFVAPAGSGPRHIVFGVDGRFAYLITELSAQLMVLRWDATQGQLTLVQALPFGSESFQGVKSGAEIVLDARGHFVYVQNRAENTLLVYQVSPDSGQLSLVQTLPSAGERPWGMAIDPSGNWLLVANQHSASVNVFGIDRVSGMLSDIHQSVSLPTPVCIAYISK